MSSIQRHGEIDKAAVMHVSVDALDGSGGIVATTWRHVNFSVVHGCMSAWNGAVSEPIPSPQSSPCGGFAQIFKIERIRV
jgi:hypothetical protein